LRIDEKNAVISSFWLRKLVVATKSYTLPVVAKSHVATIEILVLQDIAFFATMVVRCQAWQ
jgi:hypothetical protein